MSAEPLTPITDMRGELHARLLEQYKDPRQDGQPGRLSGIIDLLADEGQFLEIAWQELLPMLDVDLMEGAQLDIIGRIANVARDGLDDTDYRLLIRASFQKNDSGTPEQIIAVVKKVTASSKVWYIPEYPAGYWIICDGTGLTAELLERITPAGVMAFPFCYLMTTTERLVRTATNDPILVVGPCEKSIFPDDRTWDGAVGAVQNGTFTEAWPFRDGDGIGQHPSGGTGPINASEYTFTDGSFAVNP